MGTKALKYVGNNALGGEATPMSAEPPRSRAAVPLRRLLRYALSACVALALAPTAALATSVFTPLSGAMFEARYAPAAAALASGKVLIAAGQGSAGEFKELKTAELFDPATGGFQRLEGAGHELIEAREEAGYTALSDGKVLIVGGEGGKKRLKSAELFDPASNTFEQLTAKMVEGRDAPLAVLLANGKVLIAGGYGEGEAYLRTAELYDPQTQTFEKLPAQMAVARGYAAGGRLPDGRALIAGGYNGPEAERWLKSAEVFNPATGGFEKLAAELLTPRDEAAYAQLPNGEILLAGGAANSGPALASAEKFNPETLSFEALGSGMLAARDDPAAATFAAGQQVVLLGGAAAGVYSSSAEVLSLPPVATTLSAGAVGSASATLTGSVVAEASASTHFQYGTTTAYGASTQVSSAGPSIKPVSVTASAANLLPSTTYHFRLLAEGYGTTSYGADQTFSTPAAGAAPSVTPPALSGVSQSHRVWREGSQLASLARSHPPVGTTFVFTLSEIAKVTFTFTQAAPGRRVGHRCVAQTGANRRRPRCTRILVRGMLAFFGHQGVDRVSFQGRVSRTRRLAPGTYSLLIIASNVAGQKSAPSRLTTTIVK